MVPTYVNIIILKANKKIWQFNENWSVIGQWSYIIKFTCVITKKTTNYNQNFKIVTVMELKEILNLYV